MANEETAPQIEEKPARRHRSPAWPFIPLAKAIERVREFYRVHRDRAASSSAANVAWSMGAKSGAGFQTLATLKQYGLMREAATSGSAQLTDLALRIVQDSREVSPERDTALREAAINPPAFSDLWQQWEAEIPDDASVEYYLIREKSYSEDVAKRLLANYKESLRLAKLLKSDSIADNGEVHEEANRDIPKARKPPIAALPPSQGVKLMESERVVFTHEVEPEHGVRIVASGAVDEELIDAVAMFLELQKKRLATASKKAKDKVA
jgi:hypothetical protein